MARVQPVYLNGQLTTWCAVAVTVEHFVKLWKMLHEINLSRTRIQFVLPHYCLPDNTVNLRKIEMLRLQLIVFISHY